MALLLPKSVFIHVPKTGGVWVRRTLMANGYGTAPELGGYGHSYPGQYDAQGRLQFAFVRHPLRWFESYFRFKQVDGWAPNNPFDSQCGDKNFPIFIAKVNWFFPGYLSYIYRLYTQKGTKWEINFVGKQEHLADDLIKALKKAGEHIINEEAIKTHQRENVSLEKYPTPWEKDSMKKLIKQEQWAFDAFGYKP